MIRDLPLFPTTLVGSYPQPDWLIDRAQLRRPLPAARAGAGAVADRPEYLAEAQDDATLLAIRDQERAGLDIITDGEIRRESYSNRFATALDGVDLDNPGRALDRSGHPNPVPRVIGPIRRPAPIQGRDVEFLRAHTDRPIKITVPGPFTMSQQAQNDFYETEEELVLAYAAAVNQEVRDLFAAGADIVQLDEPYMQARPERGPPYGARGARSRARCHHRTRPPSTSASATPRSSTSGPRATRSCPSSTTRMSPALDRDRAVPSRPVGPRRAAGKTIILGVIDLDPRGGDRRRGRRRSRRALPYKSLHQLVPLPTAA